MRARALEAVIVVASVTFPLGCSGPTRAPEPDPVVIVAAWHDALAEGRPRDAYVLLHPDAREGLDEAGFVALFERQRQALVTQAAALLEVARGAEPRRRAVVTVGETRCELVHTAEGWRLTAPVSGQPGPSGPPAAVAGPPSAAGAGEEPVGERAEPEGAGE